MDGGFCMNALLFGVNAMERRQGRTLSLSPPGAERDKCCRHHPTSQIIETTNPTVAAAMTAVAPQPMNHHSRDIANRPMMRRLELMSMRSAITGTATMPLITADQTSAFTGLSSKKFPAAPNRVATA